MDNQVELQVLAELAELAGRVDVLTGEVRALRAEVLLANARKDDKCEALLAAISEEFGSDEWSVANIFEAAADPERGVDPRLAKAILEACGRRKKGDRHKQLGIYLSRRLGVTGRWRLELVPGRTNEGNAYRVTDLSPLSPSDVSAVK